EVAHALQLRAADEQLAGDRSSAGAVYPPAAHAGHDRQGARPVSTSDAAGHPRDGGEVLHRKQQDDRHTGDESGDEMTARHVGFAVVLAALLQTSAFTQGASML